MWQHMQCYCDLKVRMSVLSAFQPRASQTCDVAHVPFKTVVAEASAVSPGL